MNERQERRALTPDTRGAILVMGVFMCACVVSVLWYLAGIGDAILYRERLQEAADASAFSAAALSARGMNLIVLLNLIMACLLAVRVVMKALQAGLAVAGAIFIFIPGAQDLSALCFEGVSQMQSLINTTRNPINSTLRGLSRAQKGIALTVPGAALAGSVQVGLKYRPLVSESGAASPYTTQGLPVDEGSNQRLCEEAAHAVSQLMLMFLPERARDVFNSPFANKAEDLVNKAVGKSQVYFCELGLGGSPPDFGAEIEDNARQACDLQEKEIEARRDHAIAQYTARCRELGATCDGSEDSSPALSFAQRHELRQLRTERDNAAQELSRFEQDQCVTDKKAEANRKLNENDTSRTSNESPHTTPGPMTPKKVAPDFKNGNNRGQLIAVARGNDASLRLAPAAVRLGSFRRETGDEGIDPRANMAFAQAEFFYDCAGAWQSDACNGLSNDGNAMWHFRWRPRLRLFNAPFGDRGGQSAERVLDAAAHTQYVSELLQSTPSIASTNAYLELTKVLSNMGARRDTVILH